MRHGDLVDRSARAAHTRWWGLGLLALAEVAPRWPLPFPETRALGVPGARVQKMPRASQGDEVQAWRGVLRRKTVRKVTRILRQESAKAMRVFLVPGASAVGPRTGESPLGRCVTPGRALGPDEGPQQPRT